MSTITDSVSGTVRADGKPAPAVGIPGDVEMKRLPPVATPPSPEVIAASTAIVKDAAKAAAALDQTLIRSIVKAGVVGGLVTILWLLTFSAGALVSSEPYRQRLEAFGTTSRPADGISAATTLWELLSDLTLAGLTYTPTNLAVLCCLSALIGCLGGLATNDTEPGAADHRAKIQMAVRAVTWGFFIFLTVISGSMVLSTDPFKAPTPEQYIRLAGAASLLAFVVGWQPSLLQNLVAKVASTRTGNEAEEKKG